MKRIRGLRRHARRVQQWQQNELPDLDLAWLRQQHYDYQKLRVSPWQNYRRVKKQLASYPQPPSGLRREFLAGLLVNFTRWHTALCTLNEPTYLAIWLFETEFHRSQLVAAVQERIIHYEGIFGPTLIPASPFPHPFHTLPGLAALDWHAYYYEEPLFGFDPATTADTVLKRYVRHRSFRTETTADGEVICWVRSGRVWVGRQPTERE